MHQENFTVTPYNVTGLLRPIRSIPTQIQFHNPEVVTNFFQSSPEAFLVCITSRRVAIETLY